MCGLTRWMLAASLLALSTTASADFEICANDTNTINTGLEAAINGQDATLKLVQGTYVVYSTRLSTANSIPYSGSLTLLGGYTDATCATRVVNATNTILEATLGEGVEIDPLANLLIEGIEFKNLVNGTTIHILSGQASADQNITVRRSIFDGATNSMCSPDCSQVAGLSIEKGNTSHQANLRIANSLFYGDDSFAALTLYDHVGAVVKSTMSMTLINNTITTNSGRGINIIAGRQAAIYNNIAFGNGAVGLFVDSNGSGPLLVDNIIGSGSYPTPAPGSTGTLSTNPQFVNSAGANFHLQATSPAINSGSNSVPGGLASADLDGGPRLVGSTVDRGAYESNIDDAFTLTVTSTADSGAGSLRNAITSANINAGFHIIDFNITGGCVNRIDLASPLPDITQSLIINGYSQPGATKNTQDFSDDANWCIRLNGGGSVLRALLVPATAASTVSLSVRGIAFGGFSFAAVDLEGGGNHFVDGDYFGDGFPMLTSNGINIFIGSGSAGAQVGGTDPVQRNVILAATLAGVLIASNAQGNTVLNNFIGELASGSGADANKTGVQVSGYNNTIQDNVISGNSNYGVQISGAGAANNLLTGNRIGVKAANLCVPFPCSIPNGLSGVIVDTAAHDNSITQNVIQSNSGDGVRVVSGVGNSIRANSISGNGGLGIDLGGDGVSANDNDGAAIGSTVANRLINYPVLTSALGAPAEGVVNGTLSSLNGNYQIEVYTNGSCDGSGNGEGQVLQKTASVTIANAPNGQNGSIGFSIPLQTLGGSSYVGSALSATVTDAVGNTSEFSGCVTYVNDQIFANGFD